jgi:hypothetical protein
MIDFLPLCMPERNLSLVIKIVLLKPHLHINLLAVEHMFFFLAAAGRYYVRDLRGNKFAFAPSIHQL